MTHYILVVDDELDVKELISQRFRREIRNQDYAFTFAHDGKEAYQLVRQMPEIDMVLTDINMPVMDGLTLLSHLNELKAPLKTVVVSAYGDMENIRAAMNKGAFDFITKPIDFKDLTATIQKTLKVVADFKNTQEHLKQAQVQIEKLSSLGQMMAGIAHEINNPVGFIYGNLEPARQYIQDLIKTIELYQKHYPQPDTEIQKFIDEIELDFLIQDLPQLLSSLEIGTRRIRDIVLSIRDFSRPDEREKRAVDLHKGIENTLLLLKNRLKSTAERSEIQIIRTYGNLPKVSCYPNQINQVIMNILVNAIDALEEQENPNRSNTIHISTELISKYWVRITITDNGPGIAQDTLNQLFDPFFTTKPVGKGTGLGLAISYQLIVEQHGGTLFCQSPPEGGISFVLQLPLNEAESQSDSLAPAPDVD